MQRICPLKIFFLAILSSLGVFQTSEAQITANDSVFIGAGYANDVYYSLKNGVVKSVSRNDWDLAFQVEAFEAGLRVNEMKGFELYLSNINIDNWEAVHAPDTAGKLIPANRLYNSDTSWCYGAFNATKVREDDTDYGWGEYDMNTHRLLPNKIFFLKFPDKTVRKARVIGLTNGFKNFQVEIALLEGDKPPVLILDFVRDEYKTKNFGYYTFEDGQFKDLEPKNTDWDLVFTRYNTDTRGQKYPVVGVLTNSIFTRANGTWKGVRTAEVRGVPVSNESFDTREFSNMINLIGFDWKDFSLDQNRWIITDSLVYFLQDVEGSYWKLVMTGFTGTSNGGHYFYKKLLRPAGRNDVTINSALGIYPNPTENSNNTVYINVEPSSKAMTAHIYDLAGKEISVNELQDQTLSVGHLSAGTYLIRLTEAGENSARWAKLVVNP